MPISPSTNNAGQERRKHPRIEKHFIITVYDIDKKDADHCISQLKNISRGGLCFSSSFPLEIGTRLQTMIKTPYMGQAINIVTKVVNSKEKVPNVIYDIRVQIEQADPVAEEILQKIEKSFLQSQGNY
ncbi:MAG: PilZ domain-containing protein [Candidatus Omnitrophota bacterium]